MKYILNHIPTKVLYLIGVIPWAIITYFIYLVQPTSKILWIQIVLLIVQLLGGKLWLIKTKRFSN
jgi:hypothetical protein